MYHKSTYTGLLTNFKSFAPHEYKKRLIITLLVRTFKINSSWIGFDLDVKSLCKCLFGNLYPKRFIDRVIKQFLDTKLSKTGVKTVSEECLESRYITLPYTGNYSKIVRNKINRLVQIFCKDKVNTKLVFTTCKVTSYLSTKDPLPRCIKSNVVYSFVLYVILVMLGVPRSTLTLDAVNILVVIKTLAYLNT